MTYFTLYRHLLAKNMDGQNFREFIEKYSEFVLKSQNSVEGEKDPIMSQDGNDSHGDIEK